MYDETANNLLRRASDQKLIEQGGYVARFEEQAAHGEEHLPPTAVER